MLTKCVPGTEAANDALNVSVNKGLGFPQRGTHVGDGVHVDMPQVWDGTGRTPPGWTSSAVDNWTTSTLDSQLPISDEMANKLQSPEALLRLSIDERTALQAALLTRIDVDLSSYTPKSSSAAAEEVATVANFADLGTTTAPLSTTAKVTIGAGILAVAAGAAELAHLAGWF